MTTSNELEQIPSPYKGLEFVSKIIPVTNEENAFISIEPELGIEISDKDRIAKITHIVGRLNITYRRWMRTAAQMPYGGEEASQLIEGAQRFKESASAWEKYYREKYKVSPDNSMISDFEMTPADIYAHSSDPEVRRIGREMLNGTFLPIEVSVQDSVFGFEPIEPLDELDSSLV